MKVNEHELFVPEIGATKYEFIVGKNTLLTIVREDECFYQLEQDNSKKPLGGLIPTLQYLHRNNVKFLGKKNKPKRMFYNRTDMRHIMSMGYSIADIEAGIVYSYTSDYTKIVSSKGLVLDNDLPPGTTWCIDFTEPKLPKTRKAVLDEKQRLKDEQERTERKIKTEAAKEAFKEFFVKQKIKSDKIKEETAKTDNRTVFKNENQPKENYSNWKFWAGGAAGVVLTLVVGSLFKQNHHFISRI